MTDIPLAELYLGVFTEDLVRYAIAAGGVHLVVNRWLGRMLAARQIRAERPGWPQIRRELCASLRTVAIFAAFGSLVMLGHQAGLMRIYLDFDTHAPLWFAASLAILIVGHDAWFYWAHRLMHRPRLFRWMHRLHHMSHNPTSFTSYSFNIGEAAIHATYLPVILMVVPSHPAALFLFTAHMMLRNAIGHCGVEVFPADRHGRPLIGWMTTVTHHDLHHANARWNMGFYFTWWDRWCGTEHPDYLREFARVARHGRLPVSLVILVLATGLVATDVQANPEAPSDEATIQVTRDCLAAPRPAPKTNRSEPVRDWRHLDGMRLSVPGLFP